MGNEEFLEIVDELFKFLRDKISLSYGQYLTDEQKERLFSFETENIVVNEESNKIVHYDEKENKIQISGEFLTPDYVEKIKSKNPEFDLVDLKNRINDENPRILLEELISFSTELNIKEKDLVKALLIQEILKMVLYKEDREAKEDAIISGTIELLAHNIGSQNGFLVATPKKLLGELEAAIGLKEELEDKFESVVLGGTSLEHLSRIENRRLLEKIDELTDNRKIIESTQNLDNVIDSIVNMTEKTEKEISEKEEKVKDDTEEIVDLDKTIEMEKIKDEIEKEASKNEELLNKEIEENKLEQTKPTTFFSGKARIILSIVGVILVVAFGVLVGWLLFKFK